MIRKKEIRGKTVRKLHRLARELETIYGVRVKWGSGFYEGKRYFYFEPIPVKRWHKDCFCSNGFAYSVKQALTNFYRDWYLVLYFEKHLPENHGKFVTVKADYRPGRYQYDPELITARGLHPRQFFRNPVNGRIYEHKAFFKAHSN